MRSYYSRVSPHFFSATPPQWIEHVRRWRTGLSSCGSSLAGQGDWDIWEWVRGERGSGWREACWDFLESRLDLWHPAVHRLLLHTFTFFWLLPIYTFAFALRQLAYRRHAHISELRGVLYCSNRLGCRDISWRWFELISTVKNVYFSGEPFLLFFWIKIAIERGDETHISIIFTLH